MSKEPSDFSIKNPESADQTQFVNRSNGSKYQPILDQAVKLKQGEKFDVTAPKGMEVNKFNVLVTSAVSAKLSKMAPAGSHYSKRKTATGLMIGLFANKAPAKAKAPVEPKALEPAAKAPVKPKAPAKAKASAKK